VDESRRAVRAVAAVCKTRGKIAQDAAGIKQRYNFFCLFFRLGALLAVRVVAARR
jgi:hypothetical protein